LRGDPADESFPRSVTSRRSRFSTHRRPRRSAPVTGCCHELGRSTRTNELTRSATSLARLPLDPTLGRMLLQARPKRRCRDAYYRGRLSVPDPRERPEEQKEPGRDGHRAFADPDSDFSPCSRSGKAAPPAETRGRAEMRCAFLQNELPLGLRMREWRDIHRQLARLSTKTRVSLPGQLRRGI
jgi:HrpA-like RNA helicase